MSENNTNPKIEDTILKYLDGSLREAALGFTDYLHEKQMTPQQWFNSDFWRIPWGDHYLCGIHLKNDAWRFWFWKGDYGGKHDNSFVAVVHNHVRPCISCTTDCKFGHDMTVFGSEFENTCFQFPVQFENPDNDTLEHIKELIEYWKDVVPPNDAWHAHR